MVHFLIHEAADNVGVAVVDIAANADVVGRNLTDNQPLKAHSTEAIQLGHKLSPNWGPSL